MKRIDKFKSVVSMTGTVRTQLRKCELVPHHTGCLFAYVDLFYPFRRPRL
jgi:hypothetical protein